MDNRPIAFFDSGIGGTTILKEVMKNLPNEDYIYYPDTKNNPYGSKTKEELFNIVDNVIKKLVKYNPKIIVCACNTATAMVLNDIREKYKDLIFVGTEPAIKIIYDKYKDKNTLILTTKGTKESEKFQSLCRMYKTKNAHLIEAPLLAELIENNKDTYNYLYNLLNKYKNIDIVVLGCTHFPLAKENIAKVLGNVTFIDGRAGITKRIKEILETNNMHNNKNNKQDLIIINNNPTTKKRITEILSNSL